ncbi:MULTISPECIES: hypothetical protein [Pectobacterium]|uniref:hypothetical protein n=1 Tax=Pectobacterium TaxID=122277 RepID=UPI00057F1ED2|nr:MULTISPECIES: hypothetical protein [Pectobacterium]KHT35069.1 hypothetical protein RC99_10635 [Pectobacterium carotovorum subsp. carotovorum]RJL44570.1 hypothetical protein D5078_13755 [Pectobacterium carotovorum]TAI86891.1 hypothetical protein EG330_05800 [Pectobacterium versatile]UUE68954.1 hypothetical protein L0Y21_14415 [Pectobacterium aroidearum]UUE73324.1 hypothetical protein L0Y20_14525 [Pectobacterium aroidearum]
MGKYDDDFENEESYQRWLHYREYSHEARELQHKQSDSDKKPCNNSLSETQQLTEQPDGNVFRDYPEHQAMIAAAEKKYRDKQENDK